MNVEQRIEIEKQIVEKIVVDAVAAGFKLSVFDGEETAISKSTDKDKILAQLFACEVEYLRFWKFDVIVGTVTLVYGNDGWDVISDHHVCLEDVLKGATELANQLEERHG
ncbi:hypothetical protein [Burkholderia pseudomallei]|uniref:hypothetical protein n=1 Tax=Burkholderia pseudomallei TaxID=28450 RepID=UPI000536BE9B|nr:hypothetical protein [Burkholderia pseudomallei]KGX18782.1 hypothetical protein X896_774 [Burkholderia pseudomallei ABCPW 1]